MANKKVTLHPLKDDGTPDTDINLYPKTNFSQVVDAKNNVYTKTQVDNLLSNKQNILVSGTDIKTVNGNSLLGSGNINIDSSGETISIDSEVSDSSENPIQNKVIYENYVPYTGAYKDVNLGLFSLSCQFFVDAKEYTLKIDRNKIQKHFYDPDADQSVNLNLYFNKSNNDPVNGNFYFPAAGGTLATQEYVAAGLSGKQDTISDLSAIRDGATLGASAVQPVVLNNYYTSGQSDNKFVPYSGATNDVNIGNHNFISADGSNLSSVLKPAGLEAASASASGMTKYKYGTIELASTAGVTAYTLTLPEETGTLATRGYVSTNYQPLDSDLTAIAGLSGNTGLLKKTAANTWSLDTTDYVQFGANYNVDLGSYKLTTTSDILGVSHKSVTTPSGLELKRTVGAEDYTTKYQVGSILNGSYQINLPNENGTFATEGYVSNNYQPTISDLSTIRSGAALGATSVQPADLNTYATQSYVDTAIQALPSPMQFKGSLGTGGTIASLPSASASNNGYVYKVITAGTYASQSAKIGDVFISNGSSWVLIPSGDEPSGTVTNVGITMPTGFSVSGSPITSSGTLSVSFATGYSLPTNTKQSEWDSKYSKPAGGIPASDLADSYVPYSGAASNINLNGHQISTSETTLDTTNTAKFASGEVSVTATDNITINKSEVLPNGFKATTDDGDVNLHTVYSVGQIKNGLVSLLLPTTAGTLATREYLSSNYQPLDADLTAIAGLTGTSGLLKKTAADTWTLDTTKYASIPSSGTKLLGASSGFQSNISIGSGLTLSGGTLSCSNTAGSGTALYKHTFQAYINQMGGTTELVIINNDSSAIFPNADYISNAIKTSLTAYVDSNKNKIMANKVVDSGSGIHAIKEVYLYYIDDSNGTISYTKLISGIGTVTVAGTDTVEAL